jgi:2-dehydropantoate 2-reductase
MPPTLWFSGRIVAALMHVVQKPVPLIKRVTALVRKAEQEKRGSPGLTPEAVMAADGPQ